MGILIIIVVIIMVIGAIARNVHAKNVQRSGKPCLRCPWFMDHSRAIEEN